jgi:Domain of unknown function (DUF4342)
MFGAFQEFIKYAALNEPQVLHLLAMENTFFEEMKVMGRDLVEKVKSLVHEGNVRRIILKDEKGQTFLEIPLTIAAVGALAAPLLAGLGAIAALVANFTLVVERVKEDPPASV